MAEKPRLWTRMVAWVQDEVPATELEAYRRASLQVFEVMDLAEAKRLESAAAGLNPWTVPPALRAELLCAWNAFVLQTLGNEMLDADYDAHPATVGYVPPPVARQALAFYQQVEPWLDRARQADANPRYQLRAQVPAMLPPWEESARHRPSQLPGLLRAMRSVAAHAEAAMAFLPQVAPHDAEAQLNRIRQLHASAESKARYALDLQGAGDARGMDARVEPYVRDAIELFYTLGQLVAEPALAADPDSLPPGHADLPPRAVTALPGEPGFDTWCLTDRGAANELQDNERAQRALKKMWAEDPDPARTLAVQAEIRNAFERGLIAYAYEGDERVGYFHCCPWGPVFMAVQPLALAGTRLSSRQRFVYDVGALGDDAFRRRILPGNFRETGDLEFGPRRGGTRSAAIRDKGGSSAG
ncbi:MAG TPA: hypothetical protein VEQ60_08350 [Longimicrobium sp.]|nr:hypothetical protein [Longimicrobium sp.]